jgi:Amiloride-sensitive sodium channel
MSTVDNALQMNVRFNVLNLDFYDFKNVFQPFQYFRVIVHNTDELPSYSGYELIFAYPQETEVQIIPEVNLIDDSLTSMSLKSRKCYLRNEKSLKYFKIYTKKNCDQECLSGLIDEKCSCVPFYMISKERLL